MEEYINRVREALIEVDQPSMFAAGDISVLIEACKNILLKSNYRVVKINEVTGVDSPKKLVDAFYLLYQHYHADREKPYRNEFGHDLAVAKRFLKWRMESGELSEKSK